ncbi:MAG TPA: flagellar export chaperone FlgN [Syntrophothermus lipocalidus]|nr:flagellar export chaperone FlgN [Syntrophothermus lipocalidus]
MNVLEEVVEKLRREKDIFSEMLQIADRQLQQLARGAEDESWLDEFLRLLELRQGLMQEVDQLTKEVEAVRARPGSYEETGEVREKYRTLVDEIQGLIAQIQAKDTTCQEIMQARLKGLEDKLGEVRTSRKANQAYRLPPGTNPAWFIDKKR